jgi:hypothetical protein
MNTRGPRGFIIYPEEKLKIPMKDEEEQDDNV